MNPQPTASDRSLPIHKAAIAPEQQRTGSVDQFEARWISDVGEMEGLIDSWRKLATKALHYNGAFECNFLIPAFRHLATCLSKTKNVRLMVVENVASETLVGLAPFSKTKIFGLPWSAIQIWKDDQFFDTTPLLHRDYADQAWTQMIDLLKSEGHSFLELDTVSADSQFNELLKRNTNEHFHGTFQKQLFERAMLRPGSSAEDYQKQFLSTSKRKKLRRLFRKLESLGSVEFELSSPESDFPSLADEFLELECAGWKGENGTALASNPNTESFYREMIERSADHQARFITMRQNGKSLAMLSDIRSNGVVFSYKTAYHPDFADYSPGIQIELRNIEFLHQEQIQYADSCTSSDNSTMEQIWSERTPFQHLILALRGGIPAVLTKCFPLGQKLSGMIRGKNR